jgi:hypothetical protein
LQGVLIVAKYIADIHHELPNSCDFIMKSEREERGVNKFGFFLAQLMCFGKKFIIFYVIKPCKITWKYIIGNNRILLSHGDINRLDFHGMFSFVMGFFSKFF